MFYARGALDLHLPVWIAQRWRRQSPRLVPSGVVPLQDSRCFPTATSTAFQDSPCLPWLSMFPVSAGLLADTAHFKKGDLEGLFIFTPMKVLTHRLRKEGVSEVSK